tara:strand:- start:808 stop:1170 length:363 start_codon:yes stop_codon:yes gene_type:complete
MPKAKSKNNVLLDAIIDSIQSIKGNNLISLNFNDIENSICDFFIICSGTSSTHVKAIEENVRKKVHIKTKEKPWHTEQDNQADWILMDYSNIILHIFQEETRNFYNLEELWGDAKKVSYN